MSATRVSALVLLVLCGTPVLLAQANSGPGNDPGPPNSGGNPGGEYVEDLNLRQFLKKHPTIGSDVATLTGVTPAGACEGFKNLARCLTAAHLADNLDVDFACLKSRLVRGTAWSVSHCGVGTAKERLPFLYRTRLMRAVQTFRPGADSKAEIKHAMEQVERDAVRAGLSDPRYPSYSFGYHALETQQAW